MAKETTIIDNGNEFDSEESSLLHATVDQDLRNIRGGNLRRNLLGLAALFLLVGVFGISSNRSSSSSSSIAQANLLQDIFNAEEMQAVVVYSNDTVDEGQTSAFDVMDTSADSNLLSIVSTSTCKGPIDFPPIPTFNSTFGTQAVACGGGLAIARTLFSSSLGTILGKAFEDKEVLMSALKVIFGASLGGILSSGGVVLALILAAVDALWGASCLKDGKSSNELNFEDVAKISKKVVNEQLRQRDSEKYRTLTEDLQIDGGDGYNLFEVKNFAREFRTLAMMASYTSYEATLLVSNAATASLMLTEAYQLQATKMSDEECCNEAVDMIHKYRRGFEEAGTRLRKSFDDYRNEMLKESNFEEVKSKSWFCWAFWKGAYYNEYRYSVKAKDGNWLTTGYSSSGVKGSCPSNPSQRKAARDDLKRKVEEKFKDWEAKIFTEDIKKFYNDMEKTLTLSCNFTTTVAHL